MQSVAEESGPAEGVGAAHTTERYSNGALLELRAMLEDLKPWERVAMIVADMLYAQSSRRAILTAIAQCERSASDLSARGEQFAGIAHDYTLAGELIRRIDQSARARVAVL